MTTNNVFGRIYIPSILETDVTTLLKKWFPDYLKAGESELDMPVGVLKPPVNYTSRNKYDALLGEDLPKCVVICPGLIGAPEKTGAGTYTATWRLGIGVAITAHDEETAQLHAMMYGMAATLIIEQNCGELGGRSRWLDMQADDLPIRDQIHQYRAVACWFSVQIQNVITKRGGPDEPGQAPYEYHTADTVIIGKELE